MSTDKLRNNLPENRAGESVLGHLGLTEVKVKSCPNCSHPNPAGALNCHYCRHRFDDQHPGTVSMRIISLGVGVVAMLSLSLAPIWPVEQIYGKAINFLAGWGVSPLSFSLDEPGRFRELIGWVLNVYQTVHAVHYLAIIGVIGLLVVNWFKTRRLVPGGQRKMWILLGVLLLLFPAANLLISWRMFLLPGIMVTVYASLLVLAMGLFK